MTPAAMFALLIQVGARSPVPFTQADGKSLIVVVCPLTRSEAAASPPAQDEAPKEPA
jgi:hypothetical protein